jgi:microcystin-dependent protein
MPLDFPSSPSDGQVYDGYYYDATAGVWQSNNGTQVPNIFKNAEYTSAQTYMVPLTVKGKLGQTADLQRWTDSTGNVLAAIDDEGVMTVQSLVSIQPIVAVPTGSLMPFAGTTAPEYFLFCQGQAVSRTTYANLFSIIGTTYGVGDNSTTFNLPNLQGRMPVGRDSSQTEFDTLGETGGAKTHTLTTDEMPSHTHVQDAHSHNVTGNGNNMQLVDSNTADGSANRFRIASGFPQLTAVAVAATNQNTGGSQAHNNLQPYVVTNYIIKT